MCVCRWWQRCSRPNTLDETFYDGLLLEQSYHHRHIYIYWVVMRLSVLLVYSAKHFGVKVELIKNIRQICKYKKQNSNRILRHRTVKKHTNSVFFLSQLKSQFETLTINFSRRNEQRRWHHRGDHPQNHRPISSVSNSSGVSYQSKELSHSSSLCVTKGID